MEARYTFVSRTTHRDEDGGFEKWNFEVEDKTFLFVGDLRIPGIVVPHLNESLKNECKACYVDLYCTVRDDPDSKINYFNPNTCSFRSLLEIEDNVTNLLLNIVFPARNFCYLVFLDEPSNITFYQNIINKLCEPVSSEIEERIISSLNEDNKTLLQEKEIVCVMGKLKQNAGVVLN